MVSGKEFWNKRAQVYDQQVSGIYQEAYEKTAAYSLAQLHPEDRVLEFACGTGIVTCVVAPHVEHILAIDQAEEMAGKAREKVAAQDLSNVDVAVMDLFDPQLIPDSFDAVMAFNVLLYVQDLDGTLSRIRELLKPGGVFLSATDCLGGSFSGAALKKFWRSRTGKMPYVGFFTMKALQRRVEKAGFSVEQSENLFPDPPNLFLAAKKEK